MRFFKMVDETPDRCIRETYNTIISTKDVLLTKLYTNKKIRGNKNTVSYKIKTEEHIKIKCRQVVTLNGELKPARLDDDTKEFLPS